MNALLATDFISYLKSKSSAVVSVQPENIRREDITAPQFDIQDMKKTIKQPVGTGSATYNNAGRKVIVVIDYEKFLDFQPDAVIKKIQLQKPDFIVYDKDCKTHFIINELSQGCPDNKRTKAFQQMHSAVFHF